MPLRRLHFLACVAQIHKEARRAFVFSGEEDSLVKCCPGSPSLTFASASPSPRPTPAPLSLSPSQKISQIAEGQTEGRSPGHSWSSCEWPPDVSARIDLTDLRAAFCAAREVLK